MLVKGLEFKPARNADTINTLLPITTYLTRWLIPLPFQ